MLSKEEKKYIKKALFQKLKFLRYMVYAMLVLCMLFVGLPMSFQCLVDGDILHAITSILGIIYPTLFFGGFYLLIEFFSGNQIFKFIKGNYTVSREILHSKYIATEVNDSTSSINSLNIQRTTFDYFCDTQNHTKVSLIDEDSYRNAQVGGIAIIIQFGKNKNNIVAFVLPKNY